MGKKAIDARIPALIRNGMREKKRSFFVIVGDRQKDVIVNLYHILLNLDMKLNKSVLWAYKRELLGFTSHRKKREAKIKKEMKRGTRDPDTKDPFELFVSMQNIRYCYYKETDKILGNTYGMCILQDFEAITPNLLARTIETVEGGGLVLLLLKGMSSLKQLYSMTMDVHSRYRTEAHHDVVARFNERFILSLGSCGSCLVIDDEMNVLPISGGRSVVEKEVPAEQVTSQELKDTKESLADTQPVGPLVQLAKTVDQAKALLTFIEAITDKRLSSTVALTAARGRGKSAALGVAVAAAVALGYSNIFITSPSPENLKTFFQFVFRGFDALGYTEHLDYDLKQSTHAEFNKAIVRVNIYRQHRQTIQWIQPQDAYALGQAELLVIDEAAAIPLPLVRKLMGPYLIFMASTINGYEGTGRSLSLKLIQQLKEQSRGKPVEDSEQSASRAKNGDITTSTTPVVSRSLREIQLFEPIRYAKGDAVEKWLNKLLCLDATLPQTPSIKGAPHPSQCELLQVNRDNLFSFHPLSEKFLQRMMALYVASHYKNSPNDLQLMSDAPAHQLFVLTAPNIDKGNTDLPEILCVIQVALEGRISKASVQNALGQGNRPDGDLIPWTVTQQFQDGEFANLSGARIVRIATAPEHGRMGYGSKALQLLIEFYEGKHVNLTETESVDEMETQAEAKPAETSLLTETVKVREISAKAPLFSRLSEIKPPELDYVGVSYGLTPPLLKFWARAGFVPVYLRQTPNDLTGEHTMIMLRTLATETVEDNWLSAYADDFRKRFLSLLSFQFREFRAAHALEILRAASTQGEPLQSTTHPADDLTPYDLARLRSYANDMLDYHVVLDLMPSLALNYFTNTHHRGGPGVMSHIKAALLCAVGLQRKDLDSLTDEMGGLKNNQIRAVFTKVVRNLLMAIDKQREKKTEKQSEKPAADGAKVGEELQEELDAAAREVEDQWKDAERKVKEGKVANGTLVAVASGKKRKTKTDDEAKDAEQLKERKGKKLKTKNKR
ncbi:N-acetyltransferase 10 [Piedraia hortae CBS 480.64]|uniref:RNA cytidine acetyltransferase n=1 Tax=Piedraia hortae CBS 480.64 TaxID=1314780 RepID=A0A6A7BU76_9PEZI|nr:N-acetyltransferase 10 [Piedraia hortae CBS 480.64]